jgi:hypothetical protein
LPPPCVIVKSAQKMRRVTRSDEHCKIDRSPVHFDRDSVHIDAHPLGFLRYAVVKTVTQGGLRVSANDKQKDEKVEQILERVMTIAELLTRHTAEGQPLPTDGQQKPDEKTQEPRPVVQ